MLCFLILLLNHVDRFILYSLRMNLLPHAHTIKKIDTILVEISYVGLSFYSHSLDCYHFHGILFSGLPGDICRYSTHMESSWVDSSIWKVPWCYWCSSCESSIYFVVYVSYCCLFSYLFASNSYHLDFDAWGWFMYQMPAELDHKLLHFKMALSFLFLYVSNFLEEKRKGPGYLKYYN